MVVGPLGVGSYVVLLAAARPRMYARFAMYELRSCAGFETQAGLADMAEMGPTPHSAILAWSEHPRLPVCSTLV